MTGTENANIIEPNLTELQGKKQAKKRKNKEIAAGRQENKIGKKKAFIKAYIHYDRR